MFLLILGANGAETFGRPVSPLHESAQKFAHSMHVILCDPAGEETVRRARSIWQPAADYKKHIETSERLLRILKQKGQLVEGWFYNDAPNWKMIITDRSAWVRYYTPNGKHVVETPIWRFDITQSEGLFFTSSFRIFAGFGGVAKAPLWTSNCV